LRKGQCAPERRAVGYIRVSDTAGRSEDAEGHPRTGRTLYSPKSQWGPIADYARFRGLPLDAQSVSDLDESAFRQTWQKRPGMSSLVERARRGEFTDVICWKINRFARNMKEGLELLDIFEKAGVTVHFVTENISGDTASGKLLRHLMMAIAEWEADNIGENVTSALRVRARLGKPHGRPPSWVRRDPTNTFVLEEQGSASLRRLIELRLAHQGYAHIARTLNSEHHYRPQEPHITGPRLVWNASLVRRYLDESHLAAYAGDSLYGSHLEPDDPDRVVISSCWPPLVSRDTIESLRAAQFFLVHDQQLGGSQNRRLTSSPFELSPLIHCHVCGCRMHGTSGAAKNYLCAEAHTHPTTHSRLVGEDGERGAGFTVSANAIHRSVRSIMSEAVIGHRNAPLPPPRPQSPPPARRPSPDYATQLQRIVDLYKEEGLSLAQFKVEKAKIEAQRKIVEDGERNSSVSRAAERLETFDILNAASSLYAPLLRDLVQRIEFPIVTGEGHKDHVYPPGHPRNTPMRFVRVYLRPGFCPHIAYFDAPVRRMTWRKPIRVTFVRKKVVSE
jgi:DNA invertase Pin-like site-specific DNA recombinase